MNLVLDLLHLHCPCAPRPDGWPRDLMPASRPALTERLERGAFQDLMRAHSESELWWPHEDLVAPEPVATLFSEHRLRPEWEHQRAVLDAPVLAAAWAVAGAYPPTEEVQKLRNLRAFDHRWFEEAHRICSYLMVAQILQRNPGYPVR